MAQLARTSTDFASALDPSTEPRTLARLAGDGVPEVIYALWLNWRTPLESVMRLDPIQLYEANPSRLRATGRAALPREATVYRALRVHALASFLERMPPRARRAGWGARYDSTDELVAVGDLYRAVAADFGHFSERTRSRVVRRHPRARQHIMRSAAASERDLLAVGRRWRWKSFWLEALAHGPSALSPETELRFVRRSARDPKAMAAWAKRPQLHESSRALVLELAMRYEWWVALEALDHAALSPSQQRALLEFAIDRGRPDRPDLLPRSRHARRAHIEPETSGVDNVVLVQSLLEGAKGAELADRVWNVWGEDPVARTLVTAGNVVVPEYALWLREHAPEANDGWARRMIPRLYDIAPTNNGAIEMISIGTWWDADQETIDLAKALSPNPA